MCSPARASEGVADPIREKVASDGFANAATKASLAKNEKSKSAVTLDQVKVVSSGSTVTPVDEERDAVGVVDIEATGDDSLHSQTNIVDLAKCLPGSSVSTSVDRNDMAAGEGEYITIRGFDTSYNSYALDGLRLPQTDD